MGDENRKLHTEVTLGRLTTLCLISIYSKEKWWSLLIISKKYQGIRVKTILLCKVKDFVSLSSIICPLSISGLYNSTHCHVICHTLWGKTTSLGINFGCGHVTCIGQKNCQQVFAISRFQRKCLTQAFLLLPFTSRMSCLTLGLLFQHWFQNKRIYGAILTLGLMTCSTHGMQVLIKYWLS